MIKLALIVPGAIASRAPLKTQVPLLLRGEALQPLPILHFRSTPHLILHSKQSRRLAEEGEEANVKSETTPTQSMFCNDD